MIFFSSLSKGRHEFLVKHSSKLFHVTNKFSEKYEAKKNVKALETGSSYLFFYFHLSLRAWQSRMKIKRKKLFRYRFSCLFFQQQHPFTSQFIKSSAKERFSFVGKSVQWEKRKRNCLRKCLFKLNNFITGKRFCGMKFCVFS